VIDDAPEFAGAHAGHALGAAPDSSVVPAPVDMARRVFEREINRHNAEPGRRSQGARGPSCAQAFKDGLTARVRRTATAQQMYLAGSIYRAVTPDRFGRVKVDGWTCGDPLTQGDLLRLARQAHPAGAQSRRFRATGTGL